MDIAVLLVTMFFCFAIGVPIAYSLALASIAGALWIGIPLEAVMLKISDGVSKVHADHSVLRARRRHHGGRRHGAASGGVRRRAGRIHPRARWIVRGQCAGDDLPQRYFRLGR